MRINKSHYSFLAKTLPIHITDFVNRSGIQTYFNPFIKLSDGNEYKYGITNYSDLLKDLTTWNPYFLAARL